MIDRRIKFRHLTCFMEVARRRSVVAAAEALSITQPAVSKTIRELEEALGVSLFDRSRRGVEITRHGEVFLRYAGAAITALRQGVDSVAQSRAKAGIVITVGALPTVAAHVMPDAVRRYKETGAGATVRVITGPNNMLLGQLRVGELDLVVGRLADAEEMHGLTFEHLHSERIAFVVRPGHPLAGRQAVTATEIARHTVLAPDPGSIILPIVERFLIANGCAGLPDRVETVSTAFGRAYVRANDAVWIISRGAVVNDIAEGALVELAIDTADTSGPVGLTINAAVPPSPDAQLIIAAVREAAAAMPHG